MAINRFMKNIETIKKIIIAILSPLVFFIIIDVICDININILFTTILVIIFILVLILVIMMLLLFTSLIIDEIKERFYNID